MSNATKMQGTRIMKATATGKRFNQHSSISWSYLIRGRVARNQTNKKQNNTVLKPRTIDWMLKKDSFVKISGIWYPPKKRIDVIQENKTIELYSARKKKTKGTEECSVKNPATNSDSKFLPLVGLLSKNNTRHKKWI